MTDQEATGLCEQAACPDCRRIEEEHCELCGPFASGSLRKVGSDEFGPIYRCEGCDNEL